MKTREQALAELGGAAAVAQTTYRQLAYELREFVEQNDANVLQAHDLRRAIDVLMADRPGAEVGVQGGDVDDILANWLVDVTDEVFEEEPVVDSIRDRVQEAYFNFNDIYFALRTFL